jgi:hypothetical protein
MMTFSKSLILKVQYLNPDWNQNEQNDEKDKAWDINWEEIGISKEIELKIKNEIDKYLNKANN